MRQCNGCNRLLEEKSFIAKGKGKRGYICYKCKYERKSKDYKLRKRFRSSGYQLTIEEYNSMLEEQKHLCYICKDKKELVVDHNHITGDVRGLLCNSCNIGIGMLKDSPEIIKAAYQYVIRKK